jgi:sigma-B regulation protein RsbU (phosphoserine phosphatase)
MHGILSKTVLQENYLTAFALRVNKRAGKAVYLSAGHPPALYLPREGDARFLSCENPFIGMVDEFSYRSETMDVAEGDRFILYTDGLVEVGPVKKTWADSFEDLLPHVDLLKSLPRGEVAEAIVRCLGAENPEDDVAVLVVEV